MDDIIQELARAITSNDNNESPLISILQNIDGLKSEDISESIKKFQQSPWGGLISSLEKSAKRENDDSVKKGATSNVNNIQQQPFMMFSLPDILNLAENSVNPKKIVEGNTCCNHDNMRSPTNDNRAVNNTGKKVCGMNGTHGPNLSHPSSVNKINNKILVDVREMESYIAVYAEIPGVKKENINLEVENCNSVSGKTHTLKISVDKQPYAISSDEFILKERYVGVITRTIDLPSNADTELISAKYEDGVLFVRFNKTYNVKEKKKIVIQ
jgi:HSP20 family protein